MLKIVFLMVAFTTAFANSAFGDQDFSPYLENPSGLTSSADLGEIRGYETTTNPDQNLFLDIHANGEEYPPIEPQLNAVGVNSYDALLANLGDPSEPLNLLDPFGFDNKAGPPEPNTAAPPDFPVPDCGTRYLLCCSGRRRGAGLYSKCGWYNEDEADCQIKYFLFCCEYFFELVETGWLCEQCYPFPLELEPLDNA